MMMDGANLQMPQDMDDSSFSLSCYEEEHQSITLSEEDKAKRQKAYAAKWESKVKAKPELAVARAARKVETQRARRQKEKERKKVQKVQKAAMSSWFSTPKKTKEELEAECRLKVLTILDKIVDTNKVDADASLELAKSASKRAETSHEATGLIKSMRTKFERTNSESNMDEYEQADKNTFVRSNKKKPALKKQSSAPVLVEPPLAGTAKVKIDTPAKPRSIRYVLESESETEESGVDSSESLENEAPPGNKGEETESGDDDFDEFFEYDAELLKKVLTVELIQSLLPKSEDKTADLIAHCIREGAIDPNGGRDSMIGAQLDAFLRHLRLPTVGKKADKAARLIRNAKH